MSVRPRPTGAGYHHQAVDDADLARALGDCLVATRRAGERHWTAPPPEESLAATSPEALAVALAGDERSDVRTVDGLSRCLVFNATGLPGSVVDPATTAAREPVDRLVQQLVDEDAGSGAWRAAVSGHFLYPPGGYMGWHTNQRVPSRRVYLTLAVEPGRSWFGYRDPATAEIVTSHDAGADLRSFDIESAQPFWHAVWSSTWRLSIGYRLVDANATEEAAR